MNTEQQIGNNIRRYRVAKHLSQVALAEMANISSVAYSNIELGKSSPRYDTIQAISSALNVPMRDIVRSVPKLKSVRFRADKKMKDREHIIAELSKWLEDYSFLEEELDKKISPAITNLAKKYGKLRKNNKNVIEAASSVRESLDLSLKEPIINIGNIIERHGIKILTYPYNSPGFFGLSVGFEQGGPAILVNTFHRITVERWIFTTAHELGHLILHNGSYDVDNHSKNENEENEANWFAANLLIPEEGFKEEWRNLGGMPFYDQVLSIKHLYHVSYRTILHRLSELLGDKYNVQSIFKKEHKRRTGKILSNIDEPHAINSDRFFDGIPEVFRSSEPNNVDESVFPVSRLNDLVRQAIEGKKISFSRGAEILNLSVLKFRKLSNSWIAPELP